MDRCTKQKKELKPHLEITIDHLHPKGDVLEVGFALGHAAEKIQSHNPKHHTIIEPDMKIAKKAEKWAVDHPSVTIINDTWENALPRLGAFDCIFINDYEPEFEAGRVECEQGNLLLQKGKALTAKIQAEHPEITRMKYSDADIDLLFAQFGKGQGEQMAYFLNELRGNGQISPEQYEVMTKKYRLKKKKSAVPKKIKKRTDCLFKLLETCLEKHMHKGSRFACVSSNLTSRYEIPEFFEAIVTNPNLDYQETVIGASAKALVSTVEKLNA